MLEKELNKNTVKEGSNNKNIQINSEYNANKENPFFLETKSLLKNMFLISEAKNEKNEMFSTGSWVFILFNEHTNDDLKFVEQLIEIATNFSSLNFAFKSYVENSNINVFSNTINEVKTTPVILFKKGSKTKFLASREYDIVELDVLLGNFNDEIEKSDVPKCYLCNTIEGLNEEGKCTLCSGSIKKVKPKCVIDSREITPVEEIEKFINISDEHFFEFENYHTKVFGKNMITVLLKMLEETIDNDLDYKIFLVLRMCGVDIWAYSEENIKYKYRLPEENTFKKIVQLKPEFKLRIQNEATSTENTFTLSIKDFPKNMFFANHIQYDSHSKFFEGTWIFILFHEQVSIDFIEMNKIIEVVEEYPDLNFALKSFKNKEEMKGFITINVDSKVSPVILYRHEFESYLLANGAKSKEQLKKILDKLI